MLISSLCFVRYIDDLTVHLKDRGFTHPLVLMQSNGGVIEGRTACSFPIRTLQSGPAGGVISVQALARELGHENVICADVGGTTYDVALIERGALLEANKTQVNGRPIVGPIIDMASIGAGGGSIASIDEFGVVAVGPRSAGAEPGPACFGQGGTEPTVTDCHLVLGRLDPNNFLGARMKLDLEAAKSAILERVAEPAGIELEKAAAGILTVAETNMTYAIRAVTVERGLDPRDFTMFSYGGGGGLFAAAVAEELEIATIIVPRVPANFSALGMLFADYREDVAITRVQAVLPVTAREIADRLLEIGHKASERLLGFDFDRSAAEHHYSVDLRFRGQDFTLTIPVETSWLNEPILLIDNMRKRFDATHTQLYGHGSEDRSLEIVNCRCRAIGRVPRPRWPTWTLSELGGPKAMRQVFFQSVGGFIETAMFDRDHLAVGQRINGPAIVEEWTTTTLVPPGWSLTTDRIGNLELRRDGN
jgi:N-methylhydantoinase A